MLQCLRMFQVLVFLVLPLAALSCRTGEQVPNTPAEQDRAGDEAAIRAQVAAYAAKDYDVVILHGRIIDAESKLDAVRNIGITNGAIQAITDETLRGRTSIDARGLIVSPGFIDLHQHGQDQENYRLKAMDGVTAALELEYGTADVDGWYAEREGKALINYGVSAGHMPIRTKVMGESNTLADSGDAAHRAASEAEIEEMKRQIEHGLKRGAVAPVWAVQLRG